MSNHFFDSYRTFFSQMNHLGLLRNGSHQKQHIGEDSHRLPIGAHNEFSSDIPACRSVVRTNQRRLLVHPLILLLVAPSWLTASGFSLRSSRASDCRWHPELRHSRLWAETSSEVIADVSTTGEPVLTVQDLTCSHDGGTVYQLNHVNLVLQKGRKLALVGKNGCGKSTLLRTVADALGAAPRDAVHEMPRYTGTISTPRHVRVAYVEQEPPLHDNVTVGDALFGATAELEDSKGDYRQELAPVLATVRRYRRAVVQNESNAPSASSWGQILNEMDRYDGWSVLTKADEIATRLKIHHLKETFLSQLSGGERKRVALAAALLQEPSVLLADEPTNFLSVAGISWLADFLTSPQAAKLTVLLVSHDRAFLDEVCDGIVELDRGSTYEHAGSFQSYLEGKETRLALADAAVQAAQAKYRIELDWMRRQPQARETKSKARIEAFYKLQQSTKPQPRDGVAQLVEASGRGTRRLGGKIVSMRSVSLRFGDRIMLDDFSYDFCKGDRICLAGANGIGKTTFARLLTGAQAPDSGRIEVGETIVWGVYDQLGLKLDDEEQTVLDFVLQNVQARGDLGTGSMSEAPNEARRLLKQFEFPRSRWNELVAVLSGGERRRLQLMQVLSQRPNVLVLDEPSVDFSHDAIAALERYLQEEFNGVLVIVSHDRAFADKVTDHLFVFEGNGIVKDFSGSLSEYSAALVELENDALHRVSTLQNSGGTIDSGTDNFAKKITYKEEKSRRNEERNAVRRAKKDMDNLERTIESLRSTMHRLQTEIDGCGAAGWSVLAELTDSMTSVQEEIAEKEALWLEAAEIVEADGVGS
jgi:ABC transport system ATP-binding/permease protein